MGLTAGLRFGMESVLPSMVLHPASLGARLQVVSNGVVHLTPSTRMHTRKGERSMTASCAPSFLSNLKVTCLSLRQALRSKHAHSTYGRLLPGRAHKLPDPYSSAYGRCTLARLGMCQDQRAVTSSSCRTGELVHVLCAALRPSDEQSSFW